MKWGDSFTIQVIWDPRLLVIWVWSLTVERVKTGLLTTFTHRCSSLLQVTSKSIESNHLFCRCQYLWKGSSFGRGSFIIDPKIDSLARSDRRLSLSFVAAGRVWVSRFTELLNSNSELGKLQSGLRNVQIIYIKIQYLIIIHFGVVKCLAILLKTWRKFDLCEVVYVIFWFEMNFCRVV